MIPISIDISDTVEEFVLSKDETDSLRMYILDRVMTEFTDRWKDEIKDNLHSTRKEYQKGIFQEQIDDFNIIVGLTPRQSPMALMIEDGASQFDMKDGFEKSTSPKKHFGKNGQWYINVPFRLATSGAIGESFAGVMPKPIDKLAKALGSGESIKLDNIPKELQGLGKNKTSGYDHKFNIYEGLQRTEIGSEGEKRGGYVTFRRVSANSDPASFIHPGLGARDLMGKAIEGIDVSDIVDKAINEFLENR